MFKCRPTPLKQRLQEQYFKVPHDLSSRFAAGLKTYQSADGANISITDSKISVNYVSSCNSVLYIIIYIYLAYTF